MVFDSLAKVDAIVVAKVGANVLVVDVVDDAGVSYVVAVEVIKVIVVGCERIASVEVVAVDKGSVLISKSSAIEVVDVGKVVTVSEIHSSLEKKYSHRVH